MSIAVLQELNKILTDSSSRPLDDQEMSYHAHSNIRKVSSHYENMPIQIYRNFTTQKKNENFQIRNSDIFHISAENIDCGYSLEP